MYVISKNAFIKHFYQVITILIKFQRYDDILVIIILREMINRSKITGNPIKINTSRLYQFIKDVSVVITIRNADGT